MNKIEYDNQTSLPHFMDQYTIQRMERIIYFESNCTPKNEELIQAAETSPTNDLSQFCITKSILQ